MTNDELAKSYLIKATARLNILHSFIEEEAYSDVVREAQEVVELALKAMLREMGIEPPKWHDVSGLILENRDKLPQKVAANAERLAKISKWLRKERELSFYGDIDFIPTEEYSLEDAQRARRDAQFVVGEAKKVISV